ncbi:MAG: ABC transporter permease [Sphingobacteriia bacterium]|jgi:heme exporter protein B|nr:ABC transporter permease [Sphingobacteriia bacterium]
MFTEIRVLMKLEFQTEWKNKYALNGILFYTFCMVFLVSLSLSRQVNPAIWNALFWIILMFSAVNAVARSFLGSPPGIRFYLFTICSASSLIISRILYHSLLMILMGGITLVGYCFFSGNPVQDLPMYLACVALGGMGFASTLTLISGIAASAGGNASLMALLGFPVLIPLLNVLIRSSRIALDGLDRTLIYSELGFLSGLILLSGTLSYLLFPYLWRE